MEDIKSMRDFQYYDKKLSKENKNQLEKKK